MSGAAPIGTKLKGGAKKQLKAPILIKPKKNNYTIVLDPAGNVLAAYPLLEFEISNGKPNSYYDVQVVRRYSKLLTGGPGLNNFWDSAKKPKERLRLRAFSSWSNGQKTLQLDASGKAAYQMPLDWWKDQSRLPLEQFKTAFFYYRILAFPSPNPTPNQIICSFNQQQGLAPRVLINNNLLNFKVYKLRYHPDTATAGCWRRYARIEFEVSKVNTTNMYNMVQWKLGGRTYEDRTVVFGVTDYNVIHSSHYPSWQIDRVKMNPRYWNGAPNILSVGKKAYYEDDVSCGPPDGGHTIENCEISFRSKLHIDNDIPAAVTTGGQTFLADGVTTDLIRGTIDEDQAPVLSEKAWRAKMSVRQKPDGTFQFNQS
jgi:hypothetical protein